MREHAPRSTQGEDDREERWLLDRGRSVLRALLRVPLVAKVLITNAAIIAVTVTAVLLVVRGYPELQQIPPSELIIISVALALVVGAAVNAAIIRLAFAPLRELEDVAEQVAAGTVDARASVSPVADRRLRQLIAVFNGMLDHLARERERRRRLAIGTLRAEDRARRQLAAALHNDTAQRLAAHTLRLQEIQRQEEATEKDRLLDHAREEVADTLEVVRRTARGLHPPELDELGITAALRASARHHPAAADCEVHVEDEGIAEGLPQERRVALYRIFQEALSNALRHAEANRISVEMGQDDHRVYGRVIDDGRGFEDRPDRLGPDAGLGLSAMRELTEDLGGTIDIDTAAGRGTRVRVSIPLASNRGDAGKESA